MGRAAPRCLAAEPALASKARRVCREDSCTRALAVQKQEIDGDGGRAGALGKGSCAVQFN
eukprot:4514608-Amphidinium_carterae.1